LPRAFTGASRSQSPAFFAEGHSAGGRRRSFRISAPQLIGVDFGENSGFFGRIVEFIGDSECRGEFTGGQPVANWEVTVRTRAGGGIGCETQVRGEWRSEQDQSTKEGEQRVRQRGGRPGAGPIAEDGEEGRQRGAVGCQFRLVATGHEQRPFLRMMGWPEVRSSSAAPQDASKKAEKMRKKPVGDR
jgi:hypothetical protein